MYRSVTLTIEIAILSVVICSAAFASELSPIGLWKTIDDNTGKPRGLVRIMEVNGEYQGKVEKIFPKPGEGPEPKCEKCEGARRDQPVIGMTILWGLKKQGDEYQGGTILDPENGRVYRAKMTLDGDGGKLSVRGFIGFSLLGRTQTWIREQ
ncbi:MAG TPA: DUF2147 domain-containing protein [Candidatus Binatia bacterium]|nr:DUF2147 domain-containing protein [Candidatus Binatia bacterium]